MSSFIGGLRGGMEDCECRLPPSLSRCNYVFRLGRWAQFDWRSQRDAVRMLSALEGVVGEGDLCFIPHPLGTG